LADLIVVARAGADVVAAAVAHETRHLDEPRDRVENQSRSQAGQAERNAEGPKQRDGDDGPEAPEPGPHFGRVGLHGDAADDLAVERNRPDDAQVVPLELREGLDTRRGGILRQGGAPYEARAHV